MNDDQRRREDEQRWEALKRADAADTAQRPSPIDAPVGSRFADLLACALAPRSRLGLKIGDLVGAYRITDLIGEGGMGTVFAATRADGSFTQNVALKVLHRGPADEMSHRRFIQERQILAGLRHPHIARLLDGGVIQGCPYLVMERINGQPLTHYCRERQLAPEQRIRLFLQVCEAIRYAHRNGVIHRDIKPSNLLVEDTDDGQPRVAVLDFGIALQEDQAHPVTSTGQIIGTPGYMAPEQAVGDRAAVDRRSDIFSLGIILYELLSDARPFPGSDVGELLSAVLHHEAQPLRRHLPQVQKDLETIVMTCLASEPGQRYGSVQALTDDLQRYLDGSPIAARPIGRLQTWWRRARRNPRLAAIGLAAGIVTLASLAAAIGLAVRYTADLAHERNAAIDARQEAEDLLEFMLADLHQGLQRLGRLDLLRAVAEQTLTYYEEQPTEPTPGNLLNHAQALLNAGSILEDQGDASLAVEAYERVRSALAPHATGTSQPELTLQLGRAELALAGAHSRRGDITAALRVTETARDRLAALGRQVTPPTGFDEAYFEALIKLGWYLREVGRTAAALEYLDEALGVARLHAQGADRTAFWQHQLAVVHSYVGLSHAQDGQYDQALTAFEAARELCEALVAQQPANTLYREELQLIYGRIGYALIDQGNSEAALKPLQAAQTHAEILLDTEPGNANWLRELSVAHAAIGAVHRERGDHAAAYDALRASLAISRARVERSPDNVSALNDLAWDLLDVGHLQAALDQESAAHQSWSEGITAIRQVRAAHPESLYYLDTELQLLVAAGRIPEARPIARSLHDAGWKTPDFLELSARYGLLADATD